MDTKAPKRLLWISLAASAFPVHAGDIWRLYDGDSGVTCAMYNQGGKLAWRHTGGDWIDRNGTPQGNEPFGSARVQRMEQGAMSLDIGRVGEQVTLHFSGAGMKFKSRETGEGPRAVVTLADGSTRIIPATADSSISAVRADGACNTQAPLGRKPDLGGIAVVIGFPPFPEYKSARLELSVDRISGPGGVSVYRTAVPLAPLSPQTGGFAARYPRDKGICTHPGVLYCETWDREGGAAPKDWWKKTGGLRLDEPRRWTQRNGVAFPAEWARVSYAPDEGVIGAGLRVRYAADSVEYTALPTADFVKLGFGEQEHLFYRYYIKYGEEFRDPTACDGGKHPGLAGNTGFAGNSGAQVNGYNGWSLRGHYLNNCDRENPVYPRVMLATYAYHGGMVGNYGDSWSWTGHGEQGAVPLGQWVCIEGEVAANTPGVADGILRAWLDGRLVFEKNDLYLRGRKPPQGYGDWQVLKPGMATQAPTFVDPLTGRTLHLASGKTMAGNLGIEKFWGTMHHGGRHPFGKEADFWYDQTVVARERIGCIAR